MNLLILHFQNASKYPPVQNFIYELEKNKVFYKCISTGSPIGNKDNNSVVYSKYKHSSFILISLYYLFRYRPKRIIYFETYSSLPVFIYSFFTRLFLSSDILVHFHEYETLDERNKVSLYYKLLSSLETNRILPKANWISHTNPDRLQFFLSDYPKLNSKKCHIIQNMPNENWRNNKLNVNSTSINSIKKIVFVGSLGADSSLINEFIMLVNSQKYNVTLDVFSGNIDAKSKAILKSQEWIKLFPPKDYNSLPILFKNYDCGLILYSGISKNHSFSIPNKFFEYASCGLSVLTSNKLRTLNSYIINENIEHDNIGADFYFIGKINSTKMNSEYEFKEIINYINSIDENSIHR